MSDCERDIGNAIELGLPRENAAFDIGIPGNGGFDLSELPETPPVEQRDVILIPKAYETFANKTLPVLEALSRSMDVINRFEIHLLMTDFTVEWYLAKMPQRLRDVCHLHKHLPKDEVLALLKRARVMIAPSIADGTPNSMLEAMLFGVLPIMSPLESIKEWITDEENGLLVNAIDPNEIANALSRALADDQLVQRARTANLQIILERANRQTISAKVSDYYREIVSRKSIQS
jgi:glycosyltransferase involved in cell wall biosynthesis